VTISEKLLEHAFEGKTGISLSRFRLGGYF